jgi:putative nucleotidyltransferase with HDIG domain
MSGQIMEISTLPQVALRVIEVARDPEAGAVELKSVVENDPSLSARVIRLANSASMGATVRIQNLHHAISYLGFNQVRNLALTASVSKVFEQDRCIGAYRRHGLWHHLVSVGIAARLIARRCGLSNFEDAFLAGLLHDIGIILEDQNAHDAFCDVIEQLDPTLLLQDVERSILGFDHCTFGEQVGQKWGFPDAVLAAVRHHHQSCACKGEHAELVRCVEIANTLCTLKGVTSVGMKLVRPPAQTFRDMGFGREDLFVLAADLDQELARSEDLFEVA